MDMQGKQLKIRKNLKNQKTQNSINFYVTFSIFVNLFIHCNL